MTDHPRNTYRILLQPDPDRTLDDPGTIEFTIILTQNQLIGIADMARVLFTDRRDPDNPVNESGLRINYFEVRSNASIPVNIGPGNSIAYVPNVYLSDFREALNRGVPWTVAVTDPTLVQVLPSRPDSYSVPINMYSAIFLVYYNTFSGEIVEFESLEILQGAISLCQWLGQNWREWIMDIHHGNTRMVVDNI
jgi:hypothetical protein